jgi:hypothetical protein
MRTVYQTPVMFLNNLSVDGNFSKYDYGLYTGHTLSVPSLQPYEDADDIINEGLPACREELREFLDCLQNGGDSSGNHKPIMPQPSRTKKPTDLSYHNGLVSVPAPYSTLLDTVQTTHFLQVEVSQRNSVGTPSYVEYRSNSPCTFPCGISDTSTDFSGLVDTTCIIPCNTSKDLLVDTTIIPCDTSNVLSGLVDTDERTITVTTTEGATAANILVAASGALTLYAVAALLIVLIFILLVKGLWKSLKYVFRKIKPDNHARDDRDGGPCD